MTNIFLLNGHKVVWCPSAKAITYSPPTVMKFLKQQLRWARSHIISMPFLISKIKNWNVLFSYFTIKLYFQYLYQINLYCALLYFSIKNRSLYPLMVITLSILIVSSIKSTVAALYTRTTDFKYLIVYNLYAFFIFNPIIIYGLFTPNRDSWLTRIVKKK